VKLRGRAVPSLVLPLVAVAIAVAPAGSQPVTAAGGDVATVNGQGISQDDFEATIEDLQERQGAVTDTITGEQARVVIREMVVNEVLRQRLVAEGIDPEAGELDDSTAVVLAERTHYQELLAEAGVLDLDAVQAEYEETGEAGGLLCLRLFVVADTDAGDEAMERLDDGEEFADVAADYDEQFAASAGSITGEPTQPCIDPTELTEAAAPIVEALLDAGIGTPVGPIETEVATVIAVIPPFDEVRGQFEDAAFGPAIEEMVAEADVTIDPRYGRWDAAGATVVALDEPPAGSAPVDSAADVAS
jgi:hypothetical protein